jgi:tetratricopeptide (TPR) repeat protein
MFGLRAPRALLKHWLRLDPRRLEFTGWPTVNFHRQAAMLWMNMADGVAATVAAKQAVTLAQAMRDDHALALSLFQLQLAQIAVEDFARVLSISQELEQLATRLQNQRYLAIGLLGQGMAWMQLGDFARATLILERARAAIPSEFGVMPLAMVVGQSALCALRLGDQNKAEQLAGEAMAVIDTITWAILPMTHALTHVLEVYLTIPSGHDHLVSMHKLLAHLGKIASRFPYAGPRAHFYRGRYELWQGQPVRAALSLRRSLKAAQAVNLQYEQAQAHEWLGRLAARWTPRFLGKAAELEHLRAAQSLYTRTDARWELAQLKRDFPQLS